jgi:PAS domain S-box-containing protein
VLERAQARAGRASRAGASRAGASRAGASRAGASGEGRGDGAPSDNAERGLLRAVFQDAPVPLFLIARDGTVQRVNRAAGEMIGAKPGYATGRPFTAFIALPSRAAVNSQVTAVGRTGRPRQLRCSLVAADGLVPCELVIGRVGVKGNPDESDPLLVAVRDAPAGPAPAASRAEGPDESRAEGKPRSQLGAVQAVTRRLDLVTAVARLLLENEGGYSESRTLQRCARLIARELTAWVIVDMERGHRVRRQYATGPDDPRLTELTSALAAVDPPPGSIPCTVHESGHPALVAHAEDAAALGEDLDGEPLLTRLDATSLLSVPLTDGETRFGVLTLARRTSDGHFKVADLALVQELGEQMGLAIRVDRMFRGRADAAYALRASLRPRKRPDIPGVQVAMTYMAATEDAEVGGDFYDVYRTPDGWGLAVGDVSGQGEEAAAVTAAARHAIRVLARRYADPGEVLAGANEIVLAEELALDGGFVTANIAHLAWQDDRLRVLLGSAGHPAAAVLRSDGRVLMARGGGLPLGLFADAEPATQELTLDDGDILFLYTDGMAQARGPDNAYFADRLADELAALAGREAEDVNASMRQAMIDFTGEHLVDDVTMLVMRASREEGGRTGQRDRRRASSRRLG